MVQPDVPTENCVDLKNILSRDFNVAHAAIEAACRYKVEEIGHILSRGSPDKAADSNWSSEQINQIEERMCSTDCPEDGALRKHYLHLLMYTGGEDAIDIARRLLMQCLPDDDEEISTEQLADIGCCLHTLTQIGGHVAFNTLLVLRTHKNEKVARLAQGAARRLAVKCEPHDFADPSYGDLVEPSHLEIERRTTFKKEFPLPPPPVPRN